MDPYFPILMKVLIGVSILQTTILVHMAFRVGKVEGQISVLNTSINSKVERCINHE